MTTTARMSTTDRMTTSDITRKVLVTGSSGFIGQWLGQELERRGITWVGLDKEPAPNGSACVRHHQLDMLDRDALVACVKQEQPTAVIHLAARTDLLETRDINGYAINMKGVRNLCDAVASVGTVKRALYTSTQLVCRIGYIPKSDTDYNPHTLYGESKVFTETIVRETDGGGSQWALLRPTTVWGPGMLAHYQRMIALIQAGRYFHVGRSKLYKSYIYAGNIAYQYAQFLTAPAGLILGKTFWLAEYTPLSLRDYTDAIAKHLGARPIPTLPVPAACTLAVVGDALNAAGWKRFPFNSFRLRNILTEYIYDMSPTEAVCGPLPHTFEAGVEALVQWYVNRDTTAE